MRDRVDHPTLALFRALLLAALALPTPARAQGASSTDEQSAAHVSQSQVAAGLFGRRKARIRLSSENPDLVLLEPRLVGDTLEFASYAPGAWTLDTTVGQHQIMLTGITRLQIRTSSWDRGALVGLLTGAGAIEAANAAGKYKIDRGETVFVGLLFGAGGAVLGGLIGAPFHEWRTVYEAP